jgi:putative ABC transport system substrate-binding protein
MASLSQTTRTCGLGRCGSLASLWQRPPCAVPTKLNRERWVGASRDGCAQLMASVRQGLNETDFAEGRNVAFEFRWADNEYGRLPELAADLIRRQPSVIFVTGGVVSAIAAKAATKTIPIVFAQGSDPVQYGLVASSIGRAATPPVFSYSSTQPV